MDATTTNGKRKSLASQIDRLDGILDGLAEALNESVGSAVKEAVGRAVEEAVQRALVEVLTNPDVLTLIGGAARLHAPAEAPPTEDDEPASRPGGGLGAWLRGRVSRARTACREGLARVREAGAGARAWLTSARRLRLSVPALLAAALAAGAAGYALGPWLGSVAAGAAGLAAAALAYARTRLAAWTYRLATAGD